MSFTISGSLNWTQPKNSGTAEDLVKARLGDSSVTIETTLTQLEMMMDGYQGKLTSLMTDYEKGKIKLAEFSRKMQEYLTALGVSQDTIKRFLQMVGASVRPQ
jgi:mevalonate kinase